MYFKYNNTEVVIMPGVPIEMNSMLELYLNKIKSMEIVSNKIITINTIGIYETKLSNIMQSFMKKYDRNVYFSFLPSYEGVKVRLTDLDTGFDINIIKDELLDNISKYAYSLNDVTLEIVVSNIIINKLLTLSICESCTGGYISKKITDIPGSSKFFLGSVVAYNNSIIVRRLRNELHNVITRENWRSSRVFIEPTRISFLVFCVLGNLVPLTNSWNSRFL